MDKLYSADGTPSIVVTDALTEVLVQAPMTIGKQPGLYGTHMYGTVMLQMYRYGTERYRYGTEGTDMLQTYKYGTERYRYGTDVVQTGNVVWHGRCMRQMGGWRGCRPRSGGAAA